MALMKGATIESFDIIKDLSKWLAYGT